MQNARTQSCRISAPESRKNLAFIRKPAQQNAPACLRSPFIEEILTAYGAVIVAGAFCCANVQA